VIRSRHTRVPRGAAGRRAVATAAALLVFALSGPVQAHPVPFSYLDLRLQPGAIEGTLAMHILDVAHDLAVAPAERLLDPAFASSRRDEVAALAAARLRVVIDGRAARFEWGRLDVAAERRLLRLSFRVGTASPVASVQVGGRLFPHDANHRTFVNVYEGEATTQAILDGSKSTFDYFSGTRHGTLAVVRRFLPSGIHHLLVGPDHLLFLVGLLLAGGTFRRLLLVVTAFTAGHSLTLSFAALNLVSPPASIIEPAIALSIVYVGVDNLLVQGGRDVRPWIALAFGLVHGFGFANVLRAMDLPAGALGWSLLAFNVGVEVGQLLVVAAALVALKGLALWSRTAVRRVAWAGSTVVVVAGGFWFVERVFLSGGIR
jgi:hypothetical protein